MCWFFHRTDKIYWHLVIFLNTEMTNDDVIKWKHFQSYWRFVRGIHWSPVNSLHKGLWHGALIFFLQLNEWLSKKSWGWWFEMPSHPLWRHSNVMILISVPLGDKDQCITHCCWMPGDTGHQGISSHCIDPHYLEYLSFSTIRAYSSPPGQNGQDFRRHFQMHFLERKCKNVDQNLTEICS